MGSVASFSYLPHSPTRQAQITKHRSPTEPSRPPPKKYGGCLGVGISTPVGAAARRLSQRGHTARAGAPTSASKCFATERGWGRWKRHPLDRCMQVWASQAGSCSSSTGSQRAAHHGDRFFRTRAGWTEAHVHRRLQDCSSYIKDITDSKQSLKTFTERLTTVDLTKVSSVAEDVTQAIDFGKDYGGIKFESLMRGVQGVVAGVGGVFSGFAIYGALDDLKEFKAQVNEVFAELTKIHLRVEALPDVIAYQLDRATYRRLVDDGVAQVNAIVNQVNFTDALQASCRSFDDGLVSKLANTIESFTTICTPPNSQPDDVTTDKLRKCYLGIGTSVGGVLAQLVTAMSICISVRSPFASEASVA